MNKKNLSYSGTFLKTLRKSKKLRQAQVASVLGHKTVARLSQFENGVRIPDVETIVKLSRIYRTPFMKLLGVYLDAHFEELRGFKRADNRQSSSVDSDPNHGGCLYERLLMSEGADGVTIRKAQRHAADLIRTAAAKMGHF